MESRLHKFARIVEAGSFTKAARALRISQPALTAAVKKLERELAAELLVRDSHSFRLTPAGRIAYQAAKDLHTLGSNLRTRLAVLADEKVPLRLGAIDAVADMLFVHGSYLQELEEQTHLSLSIDSSSQLLKLAMADELDIVLIAKPETLPGAATSQPLGKEPMLLVGNHQQASLAATGINQGKLTRFLAYNQKSRTYQLITEHFAAAGVTLEPAFYSTSPEIVLQLALAGKGVAVLPYLLVRQALHNRRLVSIAINGSPLITRDIIALHRKGYLSPPLADNLLVHTTKTLAILYTEASQA